VHHKPFVDHYEMLQLSPNANEETVERVYRLLAKRYHPDNQSTGDAQKFSAVLVAYQVLSDPAARASYDVKYDENRSTQWRIFDRQSASEGREQDRRIYHGILSLLYVARRRDPRSGGLGAMFLEKMLGCPQQHLEFPLWYLKQHGWIEVMDNGQLAITVTGVDKLEGQDLALPKDRLLAASSVSGTDRESAEDVRSREADRLEAHASGDTASEVA
jgi:curved DNA-binding protein CbpA